MTCHNRKTLTRTCLESIISQQHIDEGDIFLVDDGCSDGTGEFVRKHYPRANVIVGNGSLFWNGGMRLAWESAINSSQNFDFFLWLNDDVILNSGAVEMLVSDANLVTTLGSPVIIAAATNDCADSEILNYGALIRPDPIRKPLRMQLIQPCGTPRQAETVSGNIVLVSKSAGEALGNLSAKFEHIYGDLDYGLRATAAQIPVFLASRPGGTCPSNPVTGTSLDAQLSRWKRLKLRRAESRKVHGRDWRRFVAIHGKGGVIEHLAHRLAPYLRIIIERPNRHAAPLVRESSVLE